MCNNTNKTITDTDSSIVIREVLLHVRRERVRVTSDSGAQIATRHVRVH